MAKVEDEVAPNIPAESTTVPDNGIELASVNVQVATSAAVRNIAVDRLKTIARVLDPDKFEQEFVPMVRRLSTSATPVSRISAVALFSTCYRHAANKTKGFLRTQIMVLCEDENERVCIKQFCIENNCLSSRILFYSINFHYYCLLGGFFPSLLSIVNFLHLVHLFECVPFLYHSIAYSKYIS